MLYLGNHFKYDGWEMVEYEKGEVTIFDNLSCILTLAIYNI